MVQDNWFTELGNATLDFGVGDGFPLVGIAFICGALTRLADVLCTEEQCSHIATPSISRPKRAVCKISCPKILCFAPVIGKFIAIEDPGVENDRLREVFKVL
jgi:hypothetical protein